MKPWKPCAQFMWTTPKSRAEKAMATQGAQARPARSPEALDLVGATEALDAVGAT